MLVREFHHTLDHRLMTQVHAIKCAQCHHAFLSLLNEGHSIEPSASGVRCVISISVLFLLSVRCYSCNIDVVVRGLYQAALFTASTLREGEYGDRLGLMSVCTLDNRRHIMRLRHNGGSGLADCTLNTAAEA